MPQDDQLASVAASIAQEPSAYAFQLAFLDDLDLEHWRFYCLHVVSTEEDYLNGLVLLACQLIQENFLLLFAAQFEIDLKAFWENWLIFVAHRQNVGACYSFDYQALLVV